jgi:membrane-associated phospholipid phosphatase
MIDASEPFAVRILGALGFFVAFAAVTAAVVARRSPVKRFDERFMAALARRRTDRLDGAAGPLSMLATQEPLTVQGMIAFVMIIVTIGGNAPLHFAVAAVGSGLLSELVKRTVARPRPAGPHLIRWIRGFSYPSGDLLTASAIHLTIALIVSPHLPGCAASAVLFAIVTTLLGLLAACRVYTGVHYPSDVLGGALLGAGWALFVSAWFA